MGHEEEPYGGGSRSAAETAGLSEKSRRRLGNAKAANTIKAYDADWRDFVDWCQHHEAAALPAEPETIVNYLSDLADADAAIKANTVARRVTAISESHIAAGYDREKNPAKTNYQIGRASCRERV